MIVLSLFDGMSAGRIALERAGIKVEKYFASEIDKHAIKVSKANWPDIIHIGDVTKVRYADGVLFTENGEYNVGKIDLLIAGSPCQGFSFAGKRLAFEDDRSKLYFEFERILNECRLGNNDVEFLLENVRMKPEHQQVITNRLCVEPIFIDSKLVSAQNRKRYYWTNIDGVSVPQDRGITLVDVVGTPYQYTVPRGNNNGGVKEREKSNSLTTSAWEHNFFKVYTKKHPYKPKPNQHKAGCLTAGANSGGNHSDMDVLVFDDTEIPLSSSGRIDIHSNPNVRRYTPEECEMLQTVPVGYTAHASTSQRYKMLGNGWTVDVIAHIFQGIKKEQQTQEKLAA